MRLVPRSLLGQVLLVLAAALLIAQAISAVLLYRSADQRREAGMLNATAFQLVEPGPRMRNEAERMLAERKEGQRREGRRLIRRGRPGMRHAVRLRFSETSPLLPGETRLASRERALRSLLEQQGVAVAELEMTTRLAGADPALADAHGRLARRLRAEPEWRSHRLMVTGLRREGDETWQVARVPIPRVDRAAIGAILLQTVVLFFVLMGLMWLVLRRITGPLAALRRRTESFSASGAAAEPLPLKGPEDVAGLTAAHNAMEARIAAMLDEKDVMLGAIGHDLKTPLAALRVRVESVENDTQRAKMSATIEEITRTLDEILDLARIGRNDAPAEDVEMNALVASVVEEFEDTGKDVSFEAGSRIVAPVHLTWIKRGLRNLISNAVRYAGAAQVSLARENGSLVIRIEDDGPGIPESQLATMLEPFARGEASRNRATGGAGLGLTIARAVAEQHGGELALSNRQEGGLRAELRLPL